jgi:predicted DNA-binding transcriptional regulator YafY
VPIYADAGRSGGYTVDKSLTLPPLNFTPAEAVALAVALAQVNAGPFEGAARSAVRKIVAAMSERNVIAARDLAGRSGCWNPRLHRRPSRCPRSSSRSSSRAGC